MSLIWVWINVIRSGWVILCPYYSHFNHFHFFKLYYDNYKNQKHQRGKNILHLHTETTALAETLAILTNVNSYSTYKYKKYTSEPINAFVASIIFVSLWKHRLGFFRCIFLPAKFACEVASKRLSYFRGVVNSWLK